MNELYNRYAFALLDLAKEQNKVEDYRNEVISLVTIFKENPASIKFFNSYDISFVEKEEVINRCFLNNYFLEIVNFIKIIVKHGRAIYLYKIFLETLYRFDDYLNIERGVIYSTEELSNKRIAEIEEAIGVNTHKRVQLVNKIDETLIGGIKVVLKNDIYDSSLKGQLKGLKDLLLKEAK